MEESGSSSSSKEIRRIQRPIVTGIEQDQCVEVLEGLKEGDRVIIKGQGSVKDRSIVRVVEGG